MDNKKNISKTLVRWNYSLLAIIAVLFQQVIFGKQSVEELNLQRIDKHINLILSNHPVPSFAIGIAHGSEIFVTKGYGLANVEHSKQATADTVYRIGSISKQFAGVSILQLVKQKKIKLDDKLLEYFPSFSTQASKVTIRNLLNHTSGIVSYTKIDKSWKNTKFRHDLTDLEIIKLFQDEPLEFAPGSGYHYSNSNTFLLGVLISKVSGMEYAEYLNKYIFKPLDMHGSSYCDNYRVVPNRASGYSVTNKKIVNATYISMNVPGAAGGICSTVNDMLIWNKSLHHGEILSEQHYKLMLEPTKLSDGTVINYGFSIAHPVFLLEKKIGHTGSINGFIAVSWYYPERDLSIVVLGNTDTPIPAANVAEIADFISQIYTTNKTEKTSNVVPDIIDMARHAGIYGVGNEKIIITFNNGKLYLNGIKLTLIEKNSYELSNNPFNQYVFLSKDESLNKIKKVLHTEAGVPIWLALELAKKQ